MVAKWQIFAAIIVALVVISGTSFYVLQPQVPPPSPTPTITPSPIPTPTPTPTVSPEEEAVRKVVRAYFDAINRHSPQDVASLFTTNGTYTHFSSNKPSMIGRDEIERGYAQFFQDDPIVNIKILNITVVNISKDTTKVQCERTRLGKWRDIAPPSYTYTFDMIKKDDSWKITSVTSSIHAEIVAPRLTNIVVLDGKWTTPGEWTDAWESPMEYNGYGIRPNNGTAYIRVKHDVSYLYVLIDYVSDTTPRSSPLSGYWEGATVYFDPERNGGWEPQSNDYCYGLYTYPSGEYHAKYIVKGGKWDWQHGDTSKGIRDSMAFSSNATNNLYSTRPHAIYELKIPLPGKSEVDFFLGASDNDEKSYMTWPGKVGDLIPQAWGVLKLSQ